MTGIIAATIAFTAVPAQIIFASGANAQEESMRMSGPKNDTYWFRNADGGSQHCKVDVWGHTVDC
jgi:hypothetical protein